MSYFFKAESIHETWRKRRVRALIWIKNLYYIFINYPVLLLTLLVIKTTREAQLLYL